MATITSPTYNSQNANGLLRSKFGPGLIRLPRIRPAKGPFAANAAKWRPTFLATPEMPKLEIEEDEIDKIFRKFGLCANEDEVYSPLSEDEILQMATRAISLIPSFYHDPRRFTVAVWMLISTHVQRYETVQDPKDLDKAIEIAEKHKITAFDCSSYVNIEFSIYEMIADLYARRYYLDDISSDMENAIRLLRIATTITLQECTSACREPHSLVFHNLGVLLYEQCQSSGETSSWEEAIQMMEIAIGHHEVGNDEMSQYLNHLGTIFFGLFEKSGDIKDLDRAIGRIDEAVRLLSEPNDTSDHPDLCSYRENLESLKERRSRFFSATPSKDMTGRTRSSQVSIPTLSLVDSDSDTCVEQDGIALGVKTPTPRALNTPKDCVTQKQLCSNAHCGIARIRSPGQCQQQPQLQPAIPMSEVLFTRSKISPGEEHQSTVSSEVKIRGENSSSEDMVLSNSEPSPYQSELSDDNYRQRDAIDRFNEIMASALSRLAEDLLDDVDWGIQERPSDQSNSTSSSTSDRPTPKSTDSSTLNENSRSRKRLHETPNDLGNDSGASDEEDEDAPRRKKGKASTHELFAKPKKLKCPYYQRRPEEHTKHACRGEGFSGMGKLKDHLKRKHIKPIKCPRCWAEMDSVDSQVAHLQQNPICDTQAEPPDDRVSASFLQTLHFNSVPFAHKSMEDKWKALYTALFPDETTIPSPYDTVGMHPNMERRLFEIFEEEILKELDPAIHQLRNKIGEIMQRTRDRLRIETQPGPQQIYLESSTPGTASLETSDGNRSWENSSSDQMSSTVQTVSLNLSITDETNHDEHPPHQQHTSLVSPSGDYIGPSAPDNQYQPSPSLDSFSTPPSTTILPNAYDTSAIDFYMFRDFGPAAATPETAYTPRSLPFPSALPDYMTTSSDIDDATDTQYIFDAHGPQFTSNLDDPFAM